MEKITTRTKYDFLRAIEEIVELSESSHMNEEFFERAKAPVSHLTRRLKITPVQAVLFSLLIDSCDQSYIPLNLLASHLGVKTPRIIRYMNDLEPLEKRKLVMCRTRDGRRSYAVPACVVDDLRKDVVPKGKCYSGLSHEQLFDEFEQIIRSRDDGDITFSQAVEELRLLVEQNRHLDFCANFPSLMPFHINDFFALIFICSRLINDDDKRIYAYQMSDLFHTRSEAIYYFRSVGNGTSELVKLGYVESYCEDGIADNESVTLTEKARLQLLSHFVSMKKSAADSALLNPLSLPEKVMHYNKREAQEVARLKELLREDKFTAVCERLGERGLRRGFACLFYGSPGTGKTETVYQLARATGRCIMEVNVEEIKSKWVGDSEKNVKAIFTRYRNYVKNSERVPILLFNEADALLGTRMSNATHAVDKMENSIQNIILQEVEKLEGIMIATTNLTESLDPAFERRFLYKIRFDKPGEDAKCGIWQSLLPALSDDEARELATDFDFSGGQIENIARKQLVDSILFGVDSVDFAKVREYCNAELLNPEHRAFRVGYK